MAKKIRVIETRVYEYEPNLNGFEYKEKGITSIEEALALDVQDYQRGDVFLDELVAPGKTMDRTAEWSIVDG